jgi:hypothetical protein
MGSEALFQRSDSAVNNFARAGSRGVDFCSCFCRVEFGNNLFFGISRTGRPGLLTTSRH